MTRPAELFAIAATAVLLLRWTGRLFPSPASLAVYSVGATGYAFPLETVSLWMAAMLCMFAAVHSLWMLPLNHRASLWHFWLSAISIAVFWICSYLQPPPRALSRLGTAFVTGWFLSILVLALAQIIFVGNLLVALAKLRRHPLG